MENDDLEHIADLCLNYRPGNETNRRLDSIADQIRILELEVKILNANLDLQELQRKENSQQTATNN